MKEQVSNKVNIERYNVNKCTLYYQKMSQRKTFFGIKVNKYNHFTACKSHRIVEFNKNFTYFE
jgi:hypothetical protein